MTLWDVSGSCWIHSGQVTLVNGEFRTITCDRYYKYLLM